MNPELTLLLSLTQHVIRHTEKPPIPAFDERRFFKLTKENGLQAIVFKALKKDDISLELYQRLQNDTLAFIAADTKQRHLITELTHLFTEHNEPFIFLKGTHLKTLYPEPHLRGMGDIDVLIKADAVKRMRTLLQNRGYALTHKSPQHDVYETLGLTLEVHPTLYKAFDDKFAPLFDDVWAQTIQTTHPEHHFNPAFELCYLAYHLAKHFDSSGVGLRSVLDLGVFIEQCHTEIDHHTLHTLMEKGRIAVFLKTMVYLNHHYFGYTDRLGLLKDFTLNNETVNQLTDYIVASGIHGKGGDHNPFVARSRRKDGQKQSKLRVLFHIVFLPKSTMQVMYPGLENKGFLLPFYWVRRLFSLAFFKRKRSMHKLKSLRAVQQEQINDTETLFKTIGLN